MFLGEEESTEQTDTFCESRNQDESKELGIKDCFVRVRKLDTRNLDGNTIVAPLKEECDASIGELFIQFMQLGTLPASRGFLRH